MAKIVSISDEIYRELGNPTDMSIATISFWLRTNLGQLNNLLNISIEIDSTTLELNGTGLTADQAVIFKKLYFIQRRKNSRKKERSAGNRYTKSTRNKYNQNRRNIRAFRYR